jgi:hypothetical protein
MEEKVGGSMCEGDVWLWNTMIVLTATSLGPYACATIMDAMLAIDRWDRWLILWRNPS